jgi:hypothetical protein
MVSLPNKLSALIRVALDDEARAHKSKQYEMFMGVWHRPLPSELNKCQVCLAGAVMAFTMNADPRSDVSPSTYSTPDRRKLSSLDSVRQGHMIEALAIFLHDGKWYDNIDRKIPKLIWDVAGKNMGRIPSYYNDRAGWRKWLFKAANRLEELEY